MIFKDFEGEEQGINTLNSPLKSKKDDLNDTEVKIEVTQAEETEKKDHSTDDIHNSTDIKAGLASNLNESNTKTETVSFAAINLKNIDGSALKMKRGDLARSPQQQTNPTATHKTRIR